MYDSFMGLCQCNDACLQDIYKVNEIRTQSGIIASRSAQKISQNNWILLDACWRNDAMRNLSVGRRSAWGNRIYAPRKDLPPLPITTLARDKYVLTAGEAEWPSDFTRRIRRGMSRLFWGEVKMHWHSH